MSEDAVAPVVAMMLLLAIGVTFFAAWNAYYVPSMKAQSEITHLKDVETGFLRFSSDIETAASLTSFQKTNVRLSEPIPLGGGEFTFDTVKSGGTLRILSEREGYMGIIVTNETIQTRTLRFSNYSYQPVNNFWQDQGYVWSYGYVNVTKGSLATPLQYHTVDNVSYELTKTLFDLDALPAPGDPANCSVMNLNAVNIMPAAGYTLASGNGNGMLVLESSVTSQQFPGITAVTVIINPDMPDGFRDTLWNVVYQRVSEFPACGNVPVPLFNNDTRTIVFSPITNMTLNLRTTEITLGAY